MKIEVSFPELDTVLRKMGIEKLVRDEHTPIWETTDTRLREEGIVSSTLDDVEVAPDGTLSYEGRKIIVYIRDQYIYYVGQYKFHIANCGTIKSMKNAGRYENRYVRSTREDGKFWVNDKSTGKTKLVDLLVCINCLRVLNYKGYNHKGYSDQETIIREFSPKDFFEIYDKKPVPKPLPEPTNTDLDAFTNEYSHNWETISRTYRESVGWKCKEEKCRIFLGNEKARKFLHVHHIDGNKSDNHSDNLRALCLHCHDNQFGHSFPENQLNEFAQFKMSHCWECGDLLKTSGTRGYPDPSDIRRALCVNCLNQGGLG